jgi:HEAT repeat protein
LGQIADRRAVAPLVLALLDTESSVRAAAAATLSKLERRWEENAGIPPLTPKIVQALNHPDYWVRHSAGKLLELLKIDPNHVAEAAAVAAMAKPVAAELPHPAVSVLADLLFDRDRDLRLAAASAFVRLRDKSAASILTAALRDADFFVREAAQTALAGLSAA